MKLHSITRSHFPGHSFWPTQIWDDTGERPTVRIDRTFSHLVSADCNIWHSSSLRLWLGLCALEQRSPFCSVKSVETSATVTDGNANALGHCKDHVVLDTKNRNIVQLRNESSLYLNVESKIDVRKHESSLFSLFMSQAELPTRSEAQVDQWCSTIFSRTERCGR